MKKASLVIVVLVAMVGSLMAQNIKKTIRVTTDEVPVAVRQAFERDFGAIPAEGFWMVHFIALQENGKTTAQPQWYSYNNRSKQEKIEARYSPTGELKLAKGLEKTGVRNASDTVPATGLKKDS